MTKIPPFEPPPPFKPKAQPVTLTDFVLQEIPRTEWAIEGIWPKRAKGIIAAPPKNGKSTISVELAVSLATGTPLFGVEKFKCHERARVTYVHQGENSAARIRKDFDLILQARGLGYMEDVLAHPSRTVNEDRESVGLEPLDSEGETRRRFWVGVKLAGDHADYQIAIAAPGKRAAIYLALDIPDVEMVTGCTTFARPRSIKWSPCSATA